MGQYVIRVEGALSAGFVSAFPALESSQHARTVLHGCLEDQSALSVVLAQLRRLGVDIVEVHRIPEPEAVPLVHGEPVDAEAS
jgi:hypothetical protein